MEILGRVTGGVVVLDDADALPEGATVVVTLRAPNLHPGNQKQRLTFPLVPSASPGSLALTNERVAELLDEEDVSS
jgi:hypothetical protein